MSATANERVLLVILATIMKMSDEAEALGGAKSIAGVASLHRVQTLIQKNGPRLAKLAEAVLNGEPPAPPSAP